MNLAELQMRLTVSVPEAAQLLGVGRDAGYRAASSGQLPVLRIGRSLRVPVPELLALLGAGPNPRPFLDEPAPVNCGEPGR